MVFKRVAGSTSSSGGDAPNEAYILLTSDRGLSRSCRAAWFLQRLGHELKEGTEEKDWRLLGTTGDSNTISQDSLVLFLVCNYSFVFVVDMSPSMAAVSSATNQVNLDQAFAALTECLQSLCQPVSQLFH
ncbi:KICSTOR complex protein SZT2-like [Dysidea avara]|uniref:KICSTOR complex protein SZT2-like n=1 Tax=Dysidea avara TaxID=196820 RepID=UPI0033236A64